MKTLSMEVTAKITQRSIANRDFNKELRDLETQKEREISRIREEKEINLYRAREILRNEFASQWPEDFTSQLILTLGFPNEENLRPLVELNEKVKQNVGNLILFAYTYQVRGLEKRYMHEPAKESLNRHEMFPPSSPPMVMELYVGRITGEFQLREGASLFSHGKFHPPVKELFTDKSAEEMMDHLLWTLAGAEKSVKVFVGEEIDKLVSTDKTIQTYFEGKVVNLVARFLKSEKNTEEEESTQVANAS